ncbi:hypothetical protein [Pseudanabaena cinerea]|nr:hypothetical protein [Pseudanabaena cinerea]
MPFLFLYALCYTFYDSWVDVLMGRKKDLEQVDAIAKNYNMSVQQRKDFGKFLEIEKKLGYGGTLNYRGDFTWDELSQKAKDFLENI